VHQIIKQCLNGTAGRVTSSPVLITMLVCLSLSPASLLATDNTTVGSAPDATPVPIPHSVTYTFEATSTHQTNQVLAANYGLNQHFSLVGQSTLVNQQTESLSTIYSNLLGVDWTLNDLLTTRVAGTGTVGVGSPTAYGGLVQFTWTLSSLWGGERYTRLITGIGYSQPRDIAAVYQLNFDPTLYQASDTVGVVQELVRGWEISLTYNYYNYLIDSSGHNSLTGATTVRVSNQCSVSLQFTGISTVNSSEMNYSGTSGFSCFVAKQRFSFGAHATGSAAPASSTTTSTSGTPAAALVTASTSSSSSGPLQWTYLGGLDLGIYW
jgi:hypothetical protein